MSAPIAVATPAASAPTAVPPLVPYSGAAFGVDNKPLSGQTPITFLIFKDEIAGEPLWSETQTVAVDTTGHYQAQLGATSPNGLPADLFVNGEARWLEVQIAGQTPQPRVLLASVPYALKAGDATTLGGLPASAYALASTRNGVAASSPTAIPDTASTVTTTGGIAGYLPKFSGATSILDSPIFVNGADVGIGTTSPIATLDVNGATILNGGMTVNGNAIYNGFFILPPSGTATASTGYDSQFFKLEASAYNSQSKTALTPRFQWEAEATGNNTAKPGATLNLLASTTATPPVETGFYFNPTGIIHFAPGQTFPGAGGGSGTITGVTVSSPLTGGGTTGTVTVGLSTSALETTLNGQYAQLNADNNFTASFNSFSGAVLGVGSMTTEGTLSAYGDVNPDAAGTNAGAISPGLRFGVTSGEGISSDRTASTGNQYGLDFYTDFNRQMSITQSGLVDMGGTATGVGQLEVDASQAAIGIYAQLGTQSSEAGTYGEVNIPGAIYGDGGATSSPQGSQIGVLGVTDDSYAGVFFNNNDDFNSSLYAENDGGGYIFQAYGIFGQGAYCNIDGGGNLRCSGSLLGSNVTEDKRTLTTYALQAAENWYEDAGSGQIERGAGHVDLDPTFAKTVNASVEYHVFLTPDGESNGLYITNKTATGFDIRENGRGKASIAFDYRIMAKRKGFEQVRLADITEQVRQQQEQRVKMRASAIGRSVIRPSVKPQVHTPAGTVNRKPTLPGGAQRTPTIQPITQTGHAR